MALCAATTSAGLTLGQWRNAVAPRSSGAERQAGGMLLARSGFAGHPICTRGCSATRSASRASSRNALAATCSDASVSGRFAELRAKGEVALIPFIVAGDPDLKTTAEALLALDANGADIIELGVPYCDPLADGPVIQTAANRALEKGTNLASVLKVLAEVSPRIHAPIVLFTYYNLVMKRGPQEFMQAIKAAGAAGIVVPDVPLEETGPLRELVSANGLELVLLTTPTTPVERARSIAAASQGFVYLVSLTGVTGARTAVQGRVESLIQELKSVTDKPIAVGFGISEPKHARQVADWGADGVIVGSAVVRLLGESASPAEGLAAVKRLIQDMKAVLVKQPVASS